MFNIQVFPMRPPSYMTTFIYHILLNKRTGCGGTKSTLILVWFWWLYICELHNTLTLSAENLIKIGSVVSDIWPDKIKSWCAFNQASTFIRRHTVPVFSAVSLERFHCILSYWPRWPGIIRGLRLWQSHAKSIKSNNEVIKPLGAGWTLGRCLPALAHH